MKILKLHFTGGILFIQKMNTTRSFSLTHDLNIDMSNAV